MTVLDSLVVDAFGISIVFAVLIALSIVIKIITKVFGRRGEPAAAMPQPANGRRADSPAETQRPEQAQAESRRAESPAAVQAEAPKMPQKERAPEKPAMQYADGELKLLDVDEKTAALIMAIVSDDSGIPLSQLYFTSIRRIKQEER